MCKVSFPETQEIFSDQAFLGKNIIIFLENNFEGRGRKVA